MKFYKNRVQVLNPVTKKWVKINTATGSIVGHKCDKKPYRRVRIRRYEMEAVKGEQGYWHATKGDWHDGGSLRTLCGRGVGPHYRRFTAKSVKGAVNCPKCKEKLKSEG